MFKVPPGKLQQLSTNNIALTINKRRTKKVELRDYIAINIALCISLLVSLHPLAFPFSALTKPDIF